MPRIVLDENVSLQVAERLAAMGYDVMIVARQPGRGMSDEAVFALAAEPPSVLVTRDAHFTNPLRFPPSKIGGVLYVTHGNLRGSEEAELVERFLRTHTLEEIKGHLVSLSRAGGWMR